MMLETRRALLDLAVQEHYAETYPTLARQMMRNDLRYRFMPSADRNEIAVRFSEFVGGNVIRFPKPDPKELYDAATSIR
jgi:hypothetical protein